MPKTKKLKEKELKDIKLNSEDHFKLKLNIGISEKDRKKIANRLSEILGDSYSLMIKLHNYHWNVRGVNFRQVHLLTEGQYTPLFTAIDELAERIRSLGYLAPGSLKEFSELSTLPKSNSQYSSLEMLSDLLKSHEIIIRKCRKLIEECESSGDAGTADLLTARMEVHEKDAWMLRSTLEE